MIPLTEKLVQWYQSDLKIDVSIASVYCRIIAQYGGPEDAAALFRLFAGKPSDFAREMLLDPVMRLGDLALAEEIDRLCFEQGRLKEDVPSAVLHALGFMGYEKYIDYMVECVSANDWYLSKDACLGLLHLPCEKHRERLKSELEKIYGQPLFPEFLPALSFKVAGEEIVPRLLAWGERASTDCNGGLVLGISLFGRTQREHVQSILMDPSWEMFSIGTGSHWWGYMAMQSAELTFRELISKLKAQMSLARNEADSAPDKRTIEDRLKVLHDLLELKLADEPHPVRFSAINQESLIELYQALFQWSGEHKDDSLTGRIGACLGHDHPLIDKYAQLRSAMELGIKRELERQVWTNSGKDQLI